MAASSGKRDLPWRKTAEVLGHVMRVSQAYGLTQSQSALDFLDIDLSTDIPVFLDATAIRSLESPWGHDLQHFLNDFFGLVLEKIRLGEHDIARRLLASLNERNEYHLGHSVGRSQGQGFGDGSAQIVWNALASDESEIAHLLTSIEDSILLVPGVGRDMISDALCNILKAPLIKFTQDACHYYGIPLADEVESGPMWNTQRHRWENEMVRLPVHATYGRFVLVPRNIVRHKITCDSLSYYRSHLLPVMQEHEIRLNTSLVQYRRDETPFVTKKDLMEKYGANKLAIAAQTEIHPDALAQYKRDVARKSMPPLSHNELSDFVRETRTDWNSYITRLRQLPAGRATADAYEKLIEEIFTSLFYPALCNPKKQSQLHEGRKRIDITYTNEATEGFFYWIKDQISSLFIIVECKNYAEDIANEEIDQLAGRFSPSRGQVGLLVYRSITNRPLLARRCKDTANDRRGWILDVDDDDIVALIEEKMREENVSTLEDAHADDYRKAKFTKLREAMTRLLM